MNHLDQRWMETAASVAQQSPDPSTKVGAVFTDASGTVLLGTGFNRFPAGIPSAPEHYADRAFKYKHIRHAEVWAGLEALRGPKNHLLRGGQLYTSFTCCPNCARYAFGLGVSRVIFPPLDTSGRPEEWVAQWRQWREETLDILQSANVMVTIRHV